MNTMKVIGLAIALMLGTGLMAQQAPVDQKQKKEQREERMEKFKAMKVEYITSKLALTSEEAEKFWPVYNEFMEQMHSLEMKRKKTMREAMKKEEVSDKEMLALIELNFSTDQKILDLRKQYDAKFKEVLSVQKVGKLYMAEEQFKREVMRKMKHHKSENGAPHSKP